MAEIRLGSCVQEGFSGRNPRSKECKDKAWRLSRPKILLVVSRRVWRKGVLSRIVFQGDVVFEAFLKSSDKDADPLHWAVVPYWKDGLLRNLTIPEKRP